MEPCGTLVSISFQETMVSLFDVIPVVFFFLEDRKETKKDVAYP